MVDPTLTLSIDRTSLSLSPLVFSGAHGTTHGIVELTLPAKIARTTYAPAGRWMHGAIPSSSVWEHTGLGGTVELRFSTAADLQAAQEELESALGQLTYTVTTVKNGQSKAWQADSGSLSPSPLTLEGLARNSELFTLTIPVHPTVVPA